MTLLEVFDVMRNHVSDEIADQVLEYLFSEFLVHFKVYVFVSKSIYFIKIQNF